MKSPSKEDWHQYLTNYCSAELEGAEFIEELDEFAPGPKEKQWLKIWAAEEHHHHKLWAQLLKKKKIKQVPMKGALKSIYKTADYFVSKQDWVGCMVSASIIEHISNATASCLYPYADSQTKAVFRKITGDDLGHLNFDIQQIGKHAKTQQGRKAIKQTHKTFFTIAKQWPYRDDILDSELIIINHGFQLHRLSMERVGVNLPNITISRSFFDRIKLYFSTIFIS